MQLSNGSHTTSDNFNLLSRKFSQWFITTGSNISSKIELADLRQQSAGRGVVATQDIDEGEELFSIPRSAILTPTTSSLPSNVLDSLDNSWHKLIIAMIYESQQLSSSKWAPYLDILPRQFDTLMFWNEEELAMLEGSAVLDKIGKQSADEIFSNGLLPILRQNAETFHVGGASDEDLLGMCHRMGSAIMAYAFDIEQPASGNVTEEDEWEIASDDEAELPVGMIPMADMLNADADRNNAKLFYEEDRVSMRSIKHISKGNEIFNDYGAIPRADLLRRYGYVTDHYSQYDIVEIDQALVMEVIDEQNGKVKEDDVSRRLRYFDKHEVAVDAFDISRAIAGNHGIPESLIIFVNMMTMDAAAFDEMKKQSSLPNTHLNSMSRQNLQVLSTILIRCRSQYGARLLADDLSNLQRMNLERSQTTTQRRAKMAIEVISGEKQILQDAFDNINTTLQGVDKKRSLVDLEESALAYQETQKKQRH